MESTDGEKFECCPPFNPEPWEDKTQTWDSRKFIKDKVFTFLYMPVNFGGKMVKLDKLVTAAGAKVPDYLCLSEHTSKWNMDIYLAVDRIIPNATNVSMSGKYYSRVYEGPFSETGKWHKDFVETCRQKNLKTGKLFMWYTTCPKCAKKYGKNYTVFLAELQD